LSCRPTIRRTSASNCPSSSRLVVRFNTPPPVLLLLLLALFFLVSRALRASLLEAESLLALGSVLLLVGSSS